MSVNNLAGEWQVSLGNAYLGEDFRVRHNQRTNYPLLYAPKITRDATGDPWADLYLRDTKVYEYCTINIHLRPGQEIEQYWLAIKGR